MEHDAPENTQRPKTRGVPESRASRPRAQAILNATAKLIADRGVAETTVSEVGRAMNMRKSVVHYYFENKQALVNAVQALAERKLLTRVQAALQPADANKPRDFRSFLRPFFRAAQGDNDDFAMRLQFWAESRRESDVQTSVGETRTRLRDTLEAAIVESRAVSGEQTATVASLVMAVTDGLALAELLDGERANASEAYELLLNLLEANAQESRVLADKPSSSMRAATITA
ncbi:MAG: TetR family transcriptional regulator C-terminal domain-containing protein [Myxococcales bacterium]|nr:TetR family transcriptional regulator C-terminal domain-containing protein [Myxococcales bacterium]